MTKLNLTFLLTLLMSIVGAKAFAYQAYIDGIYYNFSGTNAMVTYRNSPSDYFSNEDAYTGNVVIPETVTYNGITYSVTGIEYAAFRSCDHLTSVTIPNSVTSIERDAFLYCYVQIVNISDLVAWCNINFYGRYSNPGQHLYLNGEEIQDLVIPNTVTSISNYAFCNFSGLKSVTIPSSVTIIGNSAFAYCSGLTSITIPNSVTSIGESAFCGCSGLLSVVVGNGVTSLPDYVFGTYRSLKSFIIGPNVQSISSKAFTYINGYDHSYTYRPNKTIWLTNTPPSGYSNAEGSINYVPNDQYNSLTNKTIYDSLFEVEGVWYVSVTPTERTCIVIDCTKTGTINVPQSVAYNETAYSVTSVGQYAFSSCSGLTSVTIPNSVTSIGSYAFHSCSDLQSVVVGNGVTNIPDYAFGTGTNIKSFTVGAGVLSISSYAFNNRPIKTIWLTNTPPNGYTNAAGAINYVANNLYTNLYNTTEYKFLSSLFEVDGVKYVPVSPSERTCDAIDCFYDESAESVHIGKTVTNKGIALTVEQVHPYAFYGNTYVKDVDLSFDGNVGNYAFYGCKNVNNAVIKNTGYLGDNAFSSITDSETFTADINNVGEIGANAFSGSTGLTNLQIGSNVTIIKDNAFNGCTGLKTATINNKGNLGNSVFQNNISLETATLGDGITSLGGNAFDGCSSLKGIIIPNSVKTLGQYAFQNCSAMTTAKMGTGVKSIETYTFAGCSSLTDMQIGSNVETINMYAFSGCTSLPEIRIPKAVTDIKNSVFYQCNGLKTVIMEDREKVLNLGSNKKNNYDYGNPLFSDCPLDSVYIGGNINYNTSSNYGYSPFYRNTSLRTVVITDKETEISTNEFYGCTNLQDVKIGDGVESFGDWAFSGCSSLKHFAFGMSVERIGKEAFSDCTAMESIASRAPEPPVCGSQALDDINKWECVLTVPAGNKAAYMAADQWKEFFFVEEGEAVNKFVTVSIEKSEGGKVLVNDKEETEVTLKRGSDVTLKFIADEGHSLAQVLVNGEDVTGQVTDGRYTLKEVVADVTVKVTFSVNSYKLIYLVDGEEYKSLDVDYGTAITPEESPEKEGYTFSGWSEIPATMPAHDVTVTGTFSINSYTLTYLLDGEEYKKVEVVYGSAITPEASPVKEGYTFSGWSEIPATMPAHDVTVTGTMIPNIYQLVYLVDGLEYKTVDVPFGTVITPEPDPEKEGYTFSGWIGLPETMPARDVTVNGRFRINSYLLTYMIDEEVYKQVVYEYGAAITPEPAPEGDYISFEWVGVPETMPAHDVTVTAVYETGITEIMVMAQQGQVRIYAPNGKKLDKLQKGLNIVVMQDGTIKKIVVK